MVLCIMGSSMHKYGSELCAENGHQVSATASCLFVEPMQWMTEISSGEVQGKLYCPG